MIGNRPFWRMLPSGRPARVGAVAVLSLTSVLYGQSGDPISFAGGDVMRGWRTFYDKDCVDCHAIWGQGGTLGPDLGRIRTGQLTAGQLSGVMWNHIPKMLGQMEQTGRPPTALTHGEMSDLFALMFFVRQLDELGDPVRGEEILRAKGCSECHETGSGVGGVGPDLAKWGKHVNPVIWAQMMWEHAPMMDEAMKRAGVTWPELEGADLVHIVAYVRSVGASDGREYLRPGSAARGQELFREKKCGDCHPRSAPDLAATDLPASVGALASRMWNHSSAMWQVMREQEVAREPISPQELADILTYLVALGNVDKAGQPERGRQVFAQKGCQQCHEGAGLAGSGGPQVAELGRDATPIGMATAMWNHGEQMLEQMTEAGLAWPVFRDDEMVDLLAFLQSVGDSGDGSGD